MCTLNGYSISECPLALIALQTEVMMQQQCHAGMCLREDIFILLGTENCLYDFKSSNFLLKKTEKPSSPKLLKETAERGAPREFVDLH